jgi:hypothetical protein
VAKASPSDLDKIASAAPKATPPTPAATRDVSPKLESSASFAKSADTAEAIAAEEHAPPLSVSTHIGLARKDGHRLITLQFADRVTDREMIVTIGYGSATRTVRVAPGSVAPVLLSSKDLGAGPSAVPVTVEAGGQRRSYILFAPIQARMGEVAAASPRAIYEGVSVKTVLLHLSAFTGLVILAEKPLDQMFVGEIPAGPPSDALERLAAELDLTVARESEAVFLLSARQ